MADYTRTHFSNASLIRRADRRSGRDHLSTASLLADLAEIDLRQIYRELGYSSMHVYCVERLRFSDDEAYNRIQAARAGRRFPAIFSEIANGRLLLTGAVLLAPRLTDENAAQLIASALDKKTREIERELAGRFSDVRPRSSAPVIREIPTESVELAARPVEDAVPDLLAAPVEAPTAESVGAPPAAATAPATAAPATAPTHRPRRFLFKMEIDEETHDDVRAIQDLLGHTVPSGDMSQVVKWMAKFCRAHLQKKRFGSKTPRRARTSQSRRHVPAQVRRAVLKRDGGQCTFVATNGHRCSSRKLLEFDHVRPVALGGKATVENMRLRCRAHNQLEAERAFGKAFVQAKRGARRASSPSATNPQKPP